MKTEYCIWLEVASTFLSLVLEKKRCNWQRRWSEGQVRSLSKKHSFFFKTSKRTRVAKLNEHMFLQFWSKHAVRVISSKLTNCRAKLDLPIDVINLSLLWISIASPFNFYVQLFNFQFIAICFRNNKLGRFFVVPHIIYDPPLLPPHPPPQPNFVSFDPRKCIHVMRKKPASKWFIGDLSKKGKMLIVAHCKKIELTE